MAATPSGRRSPKQVAGSSRSPICIAPDLRKHLDRLGPSAVLVFTSPDGKPLRHSNFYRRAWMPALETVGLKGVHLHDLRHTGNQFSADAGANIRELMERMGHDSTRAALIYLSSAPAERQRTMSRPELVGMLKGGN